MGRIIALKKELSILERSFTVHYRREESGVGAYIEVEFSSMKKMTKFCITFHLNHDYPYGELQLYSIKKLFGTVPVDEVVSIIANSSAQLGRLRRICAAVQRIC